VAERIVVKLMPNVNPNDAYLEERRFAIFKAALESATIDGEISRDEREMLDRLEAELGLEEGTARRLEDEALSAHGQVAL
jgi:uncharacterized membrane protein YebE (DUF533 family)